MPSRAWACPIACSPSWRREPDRTPPSRAADRPTDVCYGAAMNVLKAAVQGSLGLVGLRLQRRAGQPDPILLWDEDPRFARLYETIRPRTLVDTARCFILYQHL